MLKTDENAHSQDKNNFYFHGTYSVPCTILTTL